MFAAPNARHRARPRIAARRLAVLGIALVLGGVSVGIVSGTAQAAAPATTQFANETFTGTKVGDATAYQKLTTSSSTSTSAAFPCLTAGTDTAQTPVPGCATTAIDAGTGALRLTDAQQYEAAGLGATTAIPIAQGLDATFDSYQYAGNGADGIAFYLAATDPYAPAVPTAAGAFGGSLGYSTDQNTNGIANGYLGVGIDAYGNFQNNKYGGSSCADTSTTATTPSVTVRGPGNAKAGYCILGNSSTLPSGASLSGGKSGTRATSDVPVEVAINTSSSAISSKGMTGANGKVLPVVSVPAMSYVVSYYPIGGSAAQTITGTLPKVTSGSAGYRAGYFDGNGYPYKLTYGWTSSTGGSDDDHEVNRFVASSLTGQTPVLAATADPTSVQYGGAGTVALHPSVTTDGGNELGPIKVTTVFPTGTTPQAGTFTAGSYACTTTGQNVVCTYSNSGTNGTAAGSALPELDLPFTDTAAAGTSGLTIASTVASTDAAKTATASSAVTVTRIPTATSLVSSANPSTYTDPVTFTATINAQAATGTVVFTADGTTLCTTTTITNGVATCRTSALTAGSHAVVASYSGSTNLAGSSSAPLTQTVGQRSTTVALAASPSGTTYGTTSTLTATLSAGPVATGTVTFTGDDGEQYTGTVSNGVATATTSAADPVGTVTFTAAYGGDANVLGATSNAATVTISKAPTTIAATVDGAQTDHVAYGTAATLAVTGLQTGATGTVTYRNADAGRTVLCTADAATPTCTTDEALAAGTYRVTATYSGDDRYAPSDSNTVTLVVDQAASPTITVVPSPVSSTYGTTIALDETGVPTGASGTVAYTIDGAAACTATLPTTGCDASSTPGVGTHAVVATWSGDTNHTGASSAAVTIAVTKATVGIGATVDDQAADTAPYGTATTLAATGIPGDAAPGSAVRFTVGRQVLGTATAGTPTASTATDLPVGTYSVVAHWDGDANHEPVDSDPVTLTVSPQPTTITAAVDGGPNDTILHGDTAALTTDGLPADATGTVSYELADGTVLGTGDASEQGAPATTAASLHTGTYAIIARYAGDANHAPSDAPAVQLVVAKATPAITDTANGTASGQTVYGTPATLAVGSLPADATGTVQFTDQDGDLLCAVQLPTTSCTTDAGLSAGTYRVTATYLGDADHEPATTTAPATLTVAKAAGSVELGSATPSGGPGAGTGTGSGPSSAGPDVATTYGAPVTLTPTGLPAGARGVVRFVDGSGATLCSVDLGAGETSCATALGQAVGDYTVTPEWSGDDDHAAATGTPFVLAVAKAPTAVTVTAGPSTTWGSPTTLAVGGLPSDATGTVTLTAGGAMLCTVTLPATSCSTAAVQPGTTVVTATYSGDDAYDGSTATAPVVVTASHTVDTTVVHAPSTTSITATWPAVPGASGYTVTVSTSKDLGAAPRTVTVSGTGLTASIGDLQPGTQYWYRVSATAADGTVLGTHDGTAVTAAVAVAASAADPAPAALAFTGSSLSIGLIGGGALLLLVAGGLLVAANRLRAAEEAVPGPMRRGV